MLQNVHFDNGVRVVNIFFCIFVKIMCLVHLSHVKVERTKKLNEMNTIEHLYEVYKQHPVITTDNRQCEKGAMFFALKGATFDGNRFASSALDAGCAYAVVDEAEYAPKCDERYILVDDVLKTLQSLAAYHRQKLGIPVLQITGTNGKTTTKELVSAVLSKRYEVLFTQGNLNNHIGVPRTLLRIRPEHEIAVIETGANHPGEIEFLCRMVQADYGLITNVGRAHLEGFGSFDGVKRTKGELYDDLANRGKAIFLNCDDENLCQMARERGGDPLAKESKLQVNPYVEAQVEDSSSFLKIQWRANEDAPWHTVQTHLVGAYNLANIRAAVTVGLFFGVPVEDIDDALSTYVPTNSRSEFRDTGRNRLIVDAYNANPTSMNAALDNFVSVKAARKMVILGMMGELGAVSETEHRNIVERLQKMELEQVWLVGEEFQKLAEELPVSYRTFKHVDAVKEDIQSCPVTDYTILIKGSNSTKLYQLPELL